jgi:hypothetical protein
MSGGFAPVKWGHHGRACAVLSHVLSSPVNLIAARIRRWPHRVDRRRVKSILVMQREALGDLALRIPFLKELRSFRPSAYIAVVVRPEVAGLLERCTYVDEVVTWSPGVAGGFALRAWRVARAFCAASFVGARRPSPS